MRATAVIIKDGLILLIHRFFKNKEYFALPGGGVEEGETPEQAVIREIKEETNFDAHINKKLWEFYENYDKRIHHYFLVTDFSGDMELGGPEAIKNSKENSYSLEWHNIKDISRLKIEPEEGKNRIFKEFI